MSDAVYNPGFVQKKYINCGIYVIDISLNDGTSLMQDNTNCFCFLDW